ncbi:ADR114Cp [Eremothecium gossypii ATCC 10895]|uniref:ADR114Cp n=1 Tax=Eremothecium gossypii (strain ATCC 10895 / CBS 109.51 / FGSC 9923 / NRRL Y-1056) TaxID=284811 RepID=Q75A10_EREGS|nr:ADR114Cp [Eremothecium gossypii ATCC 10895]AAS52034.1 ADR114Cp [Eremothecium gossypii ATCC 10895]
MAANGDDSGFLVATRARRANAGNQLMKLLEREHNRELQMDDDDGDINLLFEEEEDDGEFLLADQRQRENDDLFSDSDEDSSESGSGDEDGELGRHERKRRHALQKRKPPVIKKSRDGSAAKRYKPSYEQPDAKSLLVETRRTSSRTSVVRNKMEVYEKLAQAEVRRKEIQERIKKQKEAQLEPELTQEDRLRIAEETERINLQSLNKYKEQEVSKKQSRLAIQQRQKMKFKAGETILTWLTTQWSVTPMMEVYDREYWEQMVSKRQKRKRKYVRRKKEKPLSDKEKPVDSTLAMQEQTPNPTAEEPASERDGKVATNVPTTIAAKNNPTGADKVTSSDDLDTPALVTDSAPLPAENTALQLTDSEPPRSTGAEAISRPQSSSPMLFENSMARHISFVEKDEVAIIHVDDPPSNISTSRDQSHELDTPAMDGDYKKFDEGSGSASQGHSPNAEASYTELSNGSLDNEFDESDAAQSGDSQKKDWVPPEDVETEEDVVYEGPDQLVGKNFLLFTVFPDEPYNIASINELKAPLFGDQWAKPLHSRAYNVESYAKISWESHPHKKEEPTLIPDLSILDKFPEFGEYDKKLSKDVTVTTNKEMKVDIRTEAPSGVFLPNGIRKRCLITNKDSQYFDPKNGVPYADVEAIKTIQDLQDAIGEGTKDDPRPRYKWFGYGRGGIYLDVQQRPAKGVPDGFS